MSYPETRLTLLVTRHATYPALWAKFEDASAIALQMWTDLPPAVRVPVIPILTSTRFGVLVK